MDHDLIGEQLVDRCKRVIENLLQAPDLHHVGRASRAICARMRQLAREMLQAKITLEAQQRRSQDVPRCCPGARVTDCPHPDGESGDRVWRDDHSRPDLPVPWLWGDVPTRRCGPWRAGGRGGHR